MLFSIQFGYTQSSNEKVLVESIQSLLEFPEGENLSDNQKLKKLNQAEELVEELDNDSIFLEIQKKIRNLYFNQNDFGNYINANHKIKLVARKLGDSSSLAYAYNALGYAFFVTEVKDSSYYYYLKSANVFDLINAETDLSYALGNLAALQFEGKDYYGAEDNSIRALKLINDVKETNEIQDHKWILYNTLANIADELGNYEKAIDYNNEALAVAKGMEDDYNNSLYTLNNIAFIKRKEGLFLESKKIFSEILNTKNLFEDDPSFYALVLENLAYTNFLTGDYNRDEIIEMFEESYKIADSLNDEMTRTGTSISMAKFYNAVEEREQAIKFAERAYDLSKRLDVNDIALESMLLLSELTTGEVSKKYLKEHINLTDSLLLVERNVRNKFARIEFETDQLEAENEQISKENLYLAILSIGLLLTAALIYVVISQRAKTKELKLVKQQQKANEDIYNLMLGQQDKVDEARAKEKIRVSKELHDGVLGRLFGTRLSLDSINFKDGKEAMMSRAGYIGQLKTIEEDIRKISHELNTDFVSGSGFMDIVSELIENQSQAYGLTSNFEYTDDINWDFVSNKTKINIFRIIQESMQNIYKHANAEHMEISISLEKNVICLYIIDDGDGFDTAKSKKGIGLKNMNSRVEDIGGSIKFSSRPEQGTKVRVKIPYSNQL
ncbi:tetratricopeptide repeat-containing sensor histidine kinase [Winogradskyella ursingii]|uniref:tetratricopeptide repeat-containing sensor histidine kinase n=1 Tax=Winogradskyella ursingii TaxID=2686079 RepID=UPI0015CBE4B7|nr:tetratricopeptide repeat-containing sensor histidine kinase [Winogradskyella ursingii]